MMSRFLLKNDIQNDSITSEGDTNAMSDSKKSVNDERNNFSCESSTSQLTWSWSPSMRPKNFIKKSTLGFPLV